MAAAGDGAGQMTSRIRAILKEHGRMPGDVESLPEDADLFEAGLTSHASVNVMLALEEAFDIEFPDSLLRRSSFESISSIRAALEQLDVAA
jgi:acyl carrier protein